MSETTEPQCQRGGLHPRWPYAAEILPPLADLPDLNTALAAGLAACRPCMAKWRRTAGESGTLATQALSLALVYASITLNAKGISPGTTGETLMQALVPKSGELLSAPTVVTLSALKVRETTDTPDGSPAATWDRRLVHDMVLTLPERHRQLVWRDALGMLMGFVQGEHRARKEEL